MSQATSWVSHLIANPDPKYPNQGYPELITQRFGKDLDQILGPKSQRIPYDQVSQAEVDRRLELVDEKLFMPNMRGGKQQLLQTLYNFLEHLETTKALWGIDLPLMNIMPMEGTERHEVEKLWINYRSQRTLYARHIVQIVFKFDPWSVFNGIGRMTKDLKRLFINDAQHRTIACMLFGIRYMAVQYMISDDENIDIDQFCACNVDNLPSEAYDNYRNRKERCDAYIEAGRTPIREDKFMWDIAQWAQRWNINICRVGDPQATGPRGVSHMADIYKAAHMGFDVMDASAAVLVKVYPTDPMKSANLVGLCELLRQQDIVWSDISYQGPNNSILSPQLEDLAEVLQERFGDTALNQNSGTYHDQCKQAINNWYKDRYNTQSNPSGISPEVKVAHATYHVYNSFSNNYTLTIPKTDKGETYQVLKSFTEGYKKWMSTQLINA
jgi:hypothetical protein